MKVIAHRGASGEYPENSLLAFEQAIKQNCHAIELDAQLHQSGEFILLHDKYVDKVTNAQGHFDQFSLAELQQLELGNGETIPTLHQAMKLIAGRCPVNIELKSATNTAKEMLIVVDKLKQLLNDLVTAKLFSWQQLIISSFNHPLLSICQKNIPTAKIATLIACCPQDYANQATLLSAYSINPSIDCLNQELVNDAHNRGLEVWVYTVDRPEDISKCLAFGVDAIFTNYPKVTQQYLNQAN